MVLPSSGAISFSNLQSEFGGSNPISLGEYYKGGSIVPTAVSYSNYGTGISGAYVPTGVPSSGSINIAGFYGADLANVYTTLYSGGTSPVKTAWSNPVSASFSVSTYLGALSSGDTFAVCSRATSGWPSGWSYGGYDTVIIACTYGSSTSLTAPQYGSKQFRIYCSYDGNNTVTVGGYYSGSSTGFTFGQAALQGIVRTN
jgi:hypothetical protein